VNAKLNEIDQSPFCYILGEVANVQDENNAPCLYDIEDIYKWVLEESCELNIPWLAWTYAQDFCDDRRMTTNGVFNTLTPYGNDLVYNPIYGLIGGNTCSATTLGTESFGISEDINFKIYPNPGTEIITISNSEYIDNISILDVSGKLIFSKSGNTETLDISTLKSGIYFLKVETNISSFKVLKLIKN
jgi:mannan endo-1,4-beta-mannosidase